MNKQFQKSNFSSYSSPRITISDIPWHYKQLEQQNNAVILERFYEKPKYQENAVIYHVK